MQYDSRGLPITTDSAAAVASLDAAVRSLLGHRPDVSAHLARALAADGGMVAALCLAGFAHQTLSVTVITMSSDLFRRSEVATAAGMAGVFGNLGLLLFSLAIGGLVARVGYSPFFVCLGVLDLLGAALLWTLVKDPASANA